MEVHFFSRQQKGSMEFTQISTKHPKHNTNNYIEVTGAVRAIHRRMLSLLTQPEPTWRGCSWKADKPKFTEDVLILNWKFRASRILKENSLTIQKREQSRNLVRNFVYVACTFMCTTRSSCMYVRVDIWLLWFLKKQAHRSASYLAT
jgi:hypothetical protein